MTEIVLDLRQALEHLNIEINLLMRIRTSDQRQQHVNDYSRLPATY